MESDMISALRARKKISISLVELEKMVPGETSYDDFAARVLELVQAGILQPVKGHGFSGKAASLANSYRILKSGISRNIVKEVERYQFSLDPRIKLEDYYTLPPSEWDKDLPFIQRIHSYLREKGLPPDEATAPEWSYRLAGDEKWIETGRGKTVLQRLGLWEQLNIASRPDPLMLALNPRVWSEPLSSNLVIENKSPFHALMDVLPDTSWLSVIYGAGWKITADLPLLERQLGWARGELEVYYFGDLDYEGISIWHSLNSARKVEPALDFYRALLDKPRALGKEGQRCNDEAREHFLSFFSPGEKKRITEVLENGAYYPQEVLSREELAEIGRKVPWKRK